MFSHFLNTYFRHSNDKGRDAALKGWATENAATEGWLFLTLGSARPCDCQLWRQGSH